MTLRTYDPENGPLEGLMLLEASAGTGKTYALERMVARLVGRSSDPLAVEEILVVTFTRRAAREMKERIRRLLSDRAAEPKRPDDERARYRRALSDFDKAPIFTIHGFCQAVLGTWPFESGAPFRQELTPGGALEESEARAWIAGLGPDDVDGDVFRAAYRRARGIDGLAAEIAAMLTRDEFPPGADIRPSEEESEDFAAYADASRLPESDLSKKAEALFGPDWSVESVKEFINAGIGKKKQTGSLEAVTDRLRACRGLRGVVRISETMYEKDTHFADFLRAAAAHREAPAAGLSGEAAALADAAAELTMEIEPYTDGTESLVEHYMRCSFLDFARRKVSERVENLKDRSGGWGYADLIRRVEDAVSRPESPLRRLLRRRYRAALIDEFQDTDPRQWDLFREVFDAPGHLLCLIGDPKQSIYGFRGTDLRAYASARATIPPDGIYRLGTNYRSRPEVVSLVNTFFAPVFRRTCDGSPPMGFESVAAGRSENDELLWHRPSPLTLLGVPGRTVQDVRSGASAAIVSEVRAVLDPAAGARWRRAKDGREEAVSPSDIAVLVRGERDEDDVLERLARAGIPARRIRSRSVLARPEASLAVGLMEAFDSPNDASLWRAVLLDDLFRIPPDLLVRFEEEGRLDEFVDRGGEWRRLFREGRSAEAFDAFFGFACRMGRWASEVRRPDQSERLTRPWEHRLLASRDGLRAWNDWRHVLELIQDRQAAGLRDIPGIIRWMRDGGDSGDPEGRDDAVRLETESPAVRVMTMHTAKGLEFPLVFLHGGFKVKGGPPSENPYRFDDGGRLVVDRLRRRGNRDRDLAYGWEEEKRLWYVAFTRASTKIWLPVPTESGSAMAVESFLEAALEAADNPTAAETPHRVALPVHLVLSPNAVPAFRENLAAKLDSFAAGPDSGLTLADGIVSEPPRLPALRSPDPTAAPLPTDSPAGRDPVTGSYTALIRSLDRSMERAAETEAAEVGSGEPGDFGDRDVDPPSALPLGVSAKAAAGLGAAGAVTGISEDEIVPLPDDRGALFGTLVHALFEECDFGRAAGGGSEWFDDEDIDGLFEGIARRYYPPDWYRSRSRPLKAMIRSALRCRVPGIGRLCDIGKESRGAEIEFLMSVPRRAELPLGDRSIVVENGFLKGFVDLLVRIGGSWWILDWKTNLPVDSIRADAYDLAGCAALMDLHHYRFQSELYLLALCRTLSARREGPVDWEREIGGAAYIFVRGTREEDSRGVDVRKPDFERMAALASSMGLEGVIL